MLKKQKTFNSNEGFTLVEVLIAISLVAFSLVALLSAFIQQGITNDSVNDMNVAIILAEEKIEEYFKYPYDNMPDGGTDYIVYDLNRTPIYTQNRSDAVKQNPFQRTVTITNELNMTLINVKVDYGYDQKNDRFLFSVNLSTRKGG